MSAPDDGDASASPRLKSVRSADLADYAVLVRRLRAVVDAAVDESEFRNAGGFDDPGEPIVQTVLHGQAADAIEQLAARVAELERVERAFRVQLAEANAALKASMARVAALEADLRKAKMTLESSQAEARKRWSGEGRQ